MQYNTVVKYNSEYSYQYSIRGTSNHQINSTDITSAVITMIQLIQHTSHSYYRVPWQFIIKRKVQSSNNQSSNNCLGVGGWSVLSMECNYQVRLGWPINYSLRFWIFPWLSMHTSEIITQPTSEALPVDRTYYCRSWTRANTHEGLEKTTLSPSFSAKSFGIRP